MWLSLRKYTEGFNVIHPEREREHSNPRQKESLHIADFPASAFESTVERQVVFPLNQGTVKRDVEQGRKSKPRRKGGYGQPCREDNRKSLMQTHQCFPYGDLAQ